MSYVMLGSDTKKQQLAQAKAAAKAAQQRQQQAAQQQPVVSMPTPFTPVPPAPSGGIFANLFSGPNLPFVIGGGVLLFGGIGYAIVKNRKS